MRPIPPLQIVESFEQPCPECGSEQGYTIDGPRRVCDRCGHEWWYERPTIVCLCGSTRFLDEFQEAFHRLSLEGKIVLTVAFATYDGIGAPQVSPKQKRRLDALHLRKIDLADEIFVLNVDGYIGPSTYDELLYAYHYHKRIKFLEPDAGAEVLRRVVLDYIVPQSLDPEEGFVRPQENSPKKSSL